MEVEELGRGQHDVELARRERRERLVALRLATISPVTVRTAQPDLGERLLEVERLVGDERAQRVDEDARPVLRAAPARAACRWKISDLPRPVAITVSVLSPRRELGERSRPAPRAAAGRR